METSSPPRALMQSDIPALSAARNTASRRQWRLLIGLILLLDGVLIMVGFQLAGWLRLNVPLIVFNVASVPNIPSTAALALIIVPLWLILFALHGLYRRPNILEGMHEYIAVFQANTIGTLILIVAGFLMPALEPARGWLLFSWLFILLLVCAERFSLRRVIQLLRQHGHLLSPALIIGDNAEALSLSEQLLGWKRSGLRLVGTVTMAEVSEEQLENGLPVLGAYGDLEALIEAHEIEELIVATSALSRNEMLAMFKQYGVRPDLTLRLSTGLFEIVTTGLDVREMAAVPLMRINTMRLTGMDRMVKFGLDYTVALIATLLLLPFLLAIAIIIRLDSEGPIIYRRRVMGLNGKQFDAFKFRTMLSNADDILDQHPDLKEKLAQEHKLIDDPRLTRFGRYLRKTSLDETPQLLNVLRREMSMVGPRMIAPVELANYNQWDVNLLTVLPGITGLWQISGRSDLTYAERVKLDMHYIRNWSIWLDVKILLQTVPAVLRSRGAY